MTISVLDTFQAWQQALESRGAAQRPLKNLRTALKLYVFEGLGLNTRPLKPADFEQFCDQWSVKQWVDALSKLPVESLVDQTVTESGQLLGVGQLCPSVQFGPSVMALFDRQFDAAVALRLTSRQTKRNYRAVLGQYLQWLVTQVWWQELFPPQLPELLPAVPRGLKRPRFRRQHSCYSLKTDQLPESLKEELAAFKDFRLTGGKQALKQRLRQQRSLGQHRESVHPRLNCVKEGSFEHKEKPFLLLFLGWCVNVRGEALAALSLDAVTDLEQLEDYVEWLVEQRHRTHCVGVQIVSIGIAVAKWKTYGQVQRRDWSDIPLIQELRELQSFFQEQYKKEQAAALTIKWKTKELTHAEARQAVQYLRQLCASHRSSISPKTGKRVRDHQRTDAVVVRAWMVHLIVKLLVYLPVRQQEIRQYRSGITLFRELETDGQPFYSALVTEHKLKSKTGEDRRYKLPAVLTQDLDDWLHIWRPKAVQAATSPALWLAFWGHEADSLEKLEQRLQAARANAPSYPSQSTPASIRRLEQRVSNLQKLIAARESAKANFETADPFFFRFGALGYRHKFGQPLESEGVYVMVRQSMATATEALFGRACWLNPHALRHVAAKHIRQIHGNKEALALLMGHSCKMADDYAKQILTDYEETLDVVDDWWKAP
ncbi:MAG: hypothetical protein ACAF41_34605 (plasmid) [Leptolyngbya sp. BL-A-14]